MVADMIELGTLKEIKDLREVWPHEAHDFTPWLAKNIGVLSETVGIDILISQGLIPRSSAA